MIEDEPPHYHLRGHRVLPCSPSQIQAIAETLCDVLKLRGQSFSPRKIGFTLNRLEEVGVFIDPIDDEEWHDLAEALVDPRSNMIYMPERLFRELNKARRAAVRVFLHELGHILLLHKPLLRFSEKPPTQPEDSEWQADYFADCVMSHLHLDTHLDAGTQLELEIFV